MRHLGILAHSTEGAARCFRTFCQEGFQFLGPHQHPDVTLDCIALAHSMSAWDQADHRSIRATPAVSVERRSAPCGRRRRPGAPGRPPASGGARHPLSHGGSVYPRALAARGIATETPGPEDRDIVNRVIFEELVNGVFTEESRRTYVRIIERLAARGCDAVALVCTEIPLLVTPDSCPLPTLESTRLLARAAFETAVGTRPLPSWRGGPVA